MSPELLPDLAACFEVLKSLGSGGRGEVALVRHREDGRLFALKTLAGKGTEAVRQFRREAALLSRLAHPNLVRIEDYFEGPPPAYAMEYVEGLPLNEALRGQTPAKILDIFVGCCRALHYLHTRGFLHRDLKPTNILVTTDGPPKLLDFGFPGWGTPAYWPREAKAGRYDAQSDLFSLGLSFLKSLGKRTDLPDYFRELLDRLIQEDPSERPSSALSLIKFLNRHVTPPFALSPEEAARTILSKPPWVTRPEEDRFHALEAKSRVVVVTGPAGVGRSRFVEEMTWRRKLTGRPTVVLADLHRTSEEDRKAQQVALRGALRESSHGSRALILLEYDADLASDSLKEWIEGVIDRQEGHLLALSDLPPEKILEIVRRATEDDPLPEKDARTLAKASGGRPLLLIEGLRQKRLGIEGAKIPETLEAACTFRVDRLNDASRRLLALLVASPEATADLEETSQAWEADVGDFQEALLHLRAEGLIAPIEEVALLRLSHPGLAPAYRSALDAVASGEQNRAHRLWMTSLTRHVSAPSAAPEAPRIVHHALASEDRDTAAAWGPAAVEYLFKAGRYDEAVTAADRLLPVCRERLARVYLLGYRAPSLYRLGRFDESLKTYDNWYTTKGDDETKVETVKHRLFTGQVLMACGERTAAREKFLAVLKTGDPESHPNLRAFHARAHALLASLCEQAGSHSETEDHLRRAEALTQNEPVLRADIENQWGLREQDRGRFPEARSRFEAAVWSSQSANDAQSEAIAWNNLAMLDRERGDFSKALQESDRALELARQGNEITQIARYRQNRALVLKDLARLPEAFSEMAASDDVLAVYAGDDLRHLSERHRNDLENLNFDTTGWDLSTDEIACREGPRFRALEGLQSLERRGPDVPESDMARAIAGIAALESPLLRAALLARLAKRLAQWKLKGLAGWLSQKVQAEAHTIHRQLPEERQWTNKKSAA